MSKINKCFDTFEEFVEKFTTSGFKLTSNYDFIITGTDKDPLLVSVPGVVGPLNFRGDPNVDLVSRDVSDLLDGINKIFSHSDVKVPIMVFRNGVLEDSVTIVGDQVTLEIPPQEGDIIILVGKPR